MLTGTKYTQGTVVVFTDSVPQMQGVRATVVHQDVTCEVTTVELLDGQVVETFTEAVAPLTLH